MRLDELLVGIDGLRVTGDAGNDVTGLTPDSRNVRPGFLFAALPGVKSNGTDYLVAAIKSGATSILVPAGTVLPQDVIDAKPPITVIETDNARLALARISAAFHGAQPGFVAAITGTNGKTSTVNFCRQIWEEMNIPAASLGTIGINAPTIKRTGSLTTPDPVALHGALAELSAAGVTHLAMEASSHGLDQCRLHGVAVSLGAFTNLTRDHLDYHGDMDGYFAAKAKLFTELVPAGGIAVLNADMDRYVELRKLCEARGQRVLSFGVNGADMTITNLTPTKTGTLAELSFMGEKHAIEIPLIGKVQVMNVCAAVLMALGKDVDDAQKRKAALAAAQKLKTVRGRFEFVGTHPNGAAIYVDYAHTPDGLETLLDSIRPHVPQDGALSVVFGCGGDRDPGKRPMMGEIAARLADRVTVTDDNPRTEDAATIRTAVMQGAGMRDSVREIGDRREAIADAVRTLGPSDILVIAGKGHEQGQIIGTEIKPFDDASVARQAIEEVKAKCQQKFGAKKM